MVCVLQRIQKQLSALIGLSWRNDSKKIAAILNAALYELTDHLDAEQVDAVFESWEHKLRENEDAVISGSIATYMMGILCWKML